MILRFTIGATHGAEGKGFEPSFPSRGNRLSRTARRTVSDYLPFEWTHRESNPGLRPAEPVSFRWTMGPSEALPAYSGPPGSRTPISGVRCRRRPVGPAARLRE